MAKLIYFTPTSLDGYIADATGNALEVLLRRSKGLRLAFERKRKL